jgi:hypothetical protein
MGDARQAAIRVAALKALDDKVSEAYERARVDALASLSPGDRLHAVLADGADIGTVWVEGRGPKPKVLNPAALLRWVKDNHPDEVETIEQVRESFLGVLLSRAENVDGEAVDAKTGEFLPGVVFKPGISFTKTSQTHDQVAAFTSALWAGELADFLPASVYPELETP